MDNILKAAIDWINEIAYPGEGFVHSNDENKVKCASRALNKIGVHVSEDEVIRYCEELEMPKESIEKIVKWFSSPNSLRLKSGMVFTVSELQSIWKDMIEEQ